MVDEGRYLILQRGLLIFDPQGTFLEYVLFHQVRVSAFVLVFLLVAMLETSVASNSPSTLQAFAQYRFTDAGLHLHQFVSLLPSSASIAPSRTLSLSLSLCTERGA
jgi:hypothetical protein